MHSRDKHDLETIEIDTDTQAGSEVSRRSLLAGAGLLGSFVVSQVSLASKARADWSQGLVPDQDARCFLKGTAIRTPGGEVPVEQLRVGQLVDTVSGTPMPITWIGTRKFDWDDCRRLGKEIAPIHIQRSALADGVPNKDLNVSAAHCLYINGLLIPAENLINGKSIRRLAPNSRHSVIEYFHIELAEHQAVFANGAPAETLLHDELPLGFDNRKPTEHEAGVVQGPSVAFAEVVRYRGGREELRSRFRSFLAPVLDRRQRLDRIRDAIADRADLLAAAA